ncbi:PIN domain-containing protein [Bacillus thuringiensis]|uniref:PIN domain-containing protein n=1 Tax=Bacillus thuringiensis TaxID=1428 RepID=UPI0037DD26B2
MIVLDTNVISELMRPEPDPAVIAWVAAQPRASLYTTSINRAEILYGVAALRGPVRGWSKTYAKPADRCGRGAFLRLA